MVRRKLVLAFSLFVFTWFLIASTTVSRGAQGTTPGPDQATAQGTQTPNAASTVGILPTQVVEATQVAQQPTPEPGERTFPETGFTVPAVFMKFWNANGGLPVFGFPISEARSEKSDIDGKTYKVQYFERNRFEHHPEFAGTNNEVLLGLLGVELTQGRDFPTVVAFENTAGKIYFPETQHSLAEPFLSYWKKYGGLAIFGYPISEPFQEKSDTDGKTYMVQYFQRNRFEFHPENPAPYDVLLGLLGKDYMDMQALLTVWGTPIPGALPITKPIWKPVKPAAGGEFLKGPHVGDGMNTQLYYQDKERILNLLDDLEFKWVTQQVEWKETENPKGGYHFAELDRIVDVVQQHNMKIMLAVVKGPEWATGGGNGFPRNPQDLEDFMAALAAHYKGRVGAYMIWNEQNLTGESGRIDPGFYVELLKAGYRGVKKSDASAIVLSGALAPTGVNDPEGKVYPMGVQDDLIYLEAMYKYHNGEMRAYADVIGTHPYGFNNPPETKWPDNPNLDMRFPVNPKKGQRDFYNLHNSFYFRRIEDQRSIMEKYGDGQKQMWVTEYGWCSDQRKDGYQECLFNTPEQQGEYVVRAMQYARKFYPWMGVMFIWNLNFSTFQEWYTGPSHYSILNPDWSPRPAYYVIKDRPRE
ncbi:MAG TPA: hypothetical protein VGE04_01470 [Chloroflexia bacterium]|jgi:hypothetical protein